MPHIKHKTQNIQVDADRRGGGCGDAEALWAAPVDDVGTWWNIRRTSPPYSLSYHVRARCGNFPGATVPAAFNAARLSVA